MTTKANKQLTNTNEKQTQTSINTVYTIPTAELNAAI